MKEMSHGWGDIDAQKIANGDTREWKKLVSHYNQVLTRHAYNITHDTQSANDVAQMVLLSLWERKLNAVDIKSLDAYLARAVKNKALTYVQQHSMEVPYSSDIAVTVLTSGQNVNNPENTAQQKELLEMISVRIEQLTPKQREVIEHILLEPDISTRELGNVLGYSHKNAQAILGRIRVRFRKIRKLLEE